jgi:hypothetical protein
MLQVIFNLHWDVNIVSTKKFQKTYPTLENRVVSDIKGSGISFFVDAIVTNKFTGAWSDKSSVLRLLENDGKISAQWSTRSIITNIVPTGNVSIAQLKTFYDYFSNIPNRYFLTVNNNVGDKVTLEYY